MSNNENHKKAIRITRVSRQNKGMLLDIYFKIVEDCPSAIVNAYRELAVEKSIKANEGFKYVCKDCREEVNAVGIVGAVDLMRPFRLRRAVLNPRLTCHIKQSESHQPHAHIKAA